MWLVSWFEKAKALEPGQSFYLTVLNKKEQTEIIRQLNELKNDYIKIDPAVALSIQVGRLSDGKSHYVFIKKVYATPTVGFQRSEDGTMVVVDITEEVKRSRLLYVMIQDGLSKEEIVELIGELTPEEEIKYFNKL